MNAAVAKWQGRRWSSTWRKHLLYAHVRTYTYNTRIVQKKHFKILMLLEEIIHTCVYAHL